MTEETFERIKLLNQKLHQLSQSQLSWIESIVNQFSVKRSYFKNEKGLIDACVLESFGDALLIHHCMSKEPFSKDKFEYLLESTFNACGQNAKIANKGNRGHDITVNGVAFSLKTQADTQIKKDEIHISKFMELGQGVWWDDPKDLEGLRDQFIHHMRNYERILSLRTLSKAPKNWFYELVEIPKSLLLESLNGELKMINSSLQNPKPGYCYVKDEAGLSKFQLYFDGGTERKLQIKHIQKKYCHVHATWEFPPIDLYSLLSES
jgi:hypothetical protein